MSCGSIVRGSGVDCDNLPPSGTNARLILINWDEVESIEEDQNGIITAINLTSGASAYEFTGFKSDVKESEEVFKSRLKSRFKHKTDFVVYEITQVQKNNIKELCKGRVLAITEKRGKDENSIEVLGKNVGLQVVQGVLRDAYETGGVFKISLSTPNNGIEFENKLPQNLGYSYEEALVIIEGLLNVVDDWILRTGDWDDDGFWRDYKTWID